MTSQIIFVIAEDGMVTVLESKAAAKGRCEAIDVENGVFAFYGQDGSKLKPRFIRPNRRRLFGLVVVQGAYELEPVSDDDPDTDTFEIAIAEACGVEPNRYFNSVPEIHAHVKKCQNSHHQASLAHDPGTGS